MNNFKVVAYSELTGQKLKEFTNLTEEEAREIVRKNANDFESWYVIRPGR